MVKSRRWAPGSYFHGQKWGPYKWPSVCRMKKNLLIGVAITPFITIVGANQRNVESQRVWKICLKAGARAMGNGQVPGINDSKHFCLAGDMLRLCLNFATLGTPCRKVTIEGLNSFHRGPLPKGAIEQYPVRHHCFSVLP